MVARKKTPAPRTVDIPVIRSGWPSGVALLSEDSLAALEGLADDPPAGSLVVLVSPFADVAGDSVELVARGILGPAVHEDYRLVTPDGERWTVADMEALVLSVSRHPRCRHVVALSDADRMEKRIFDRLLLLLEDPPTPLLMVLCVPRVETLPGTVRGRASEVMLLEVLSEPQRVRALVSKGVPESAALDAVRLAGERPSLAGLLALESPLRPLAREAFDPALPTGDRLGVAARRLGAISTLATALLEVRRDPAAAVSVPVSRFEDLAPEGKALARDLLTVFVAHRRRYLLEMLPGVSASEMSTLETALRALDLLLVRLRIPVSPLLALTELAASAEPRVGAVVRRAAR